MYKTLQIMGHICTISTGAGFLPSTVSQQRLDEALYQRSHIEASHCPRKWYFFISEEPSINVFFTGQRPQVMMFQTRFWKKAL